MTSGRADGQPWLFSINTFDPHHAFNPPADYLERYMDRLDEIPLPNYAEGELADRSPYQAFDHDGAYGHTTGFPYDQMSDFDHRLVRAAYWAMCDLIDVQVGRLLAKLEETGQLENTLVIFMSDHGEMLGDHGIYLKGPYFYEEAIHVPLIVSWPGHIQPRRVSGMVELVDIAPTLLDAAQLAPYPGMQGRSLWPLLTGEARRRCTPRRHLLRVLQRHALASRPDSPDDHGAHGRAQAGGRPRQRSGRTLRSRRRPDRTRQRLGRSGQTDDQDADAFAALPSHGLDRRSAAAAFGGLVIVRCGIMPQELCFGWAGRHQCRGTLIRNYVLIFQEVGAVRDGRRGLHSRNSFNSATKMRQWTAIVSFRPNQIT